MCVYVTESPSVHLNIVSQLYFNEIYIKKKEIYPGLQNPIHACIHLTYINEHSPWARLSHL